MSTSRDLKTDGAKIEPTTSGAAPGGPEQTRTGAVYWPQVDIFESANAITVLADMPGVKATDVRIDLRESVLTLSGRVARAESPVEVSVLREFEPGTYFRQFTLSEAIDQGKIDARLADGVLRLELPKQERAKPRQITVRAD
jgi:HSP20 family molecular chaperone IbpA